MKEKLLKSVAVGFLGTYTSRYSDKEGYWLFGYVVADLQKLDVDLLGTSSPASSGRSVAEAVSLAQSRFREQLKKHGLDIAGVRQARLLIERTRQRKELVVGDFTRAEREGWELKFHLAVVSASGKSYCGSETVFVAPHDARKEIRSTRGGSSPRA